VNVVLPDILISDHRKMQVLSKEVLAECHKREPDVEACLATFHKFKALVKAHSKAEEYTIYAFFEENSLPAYKKSREFVFSGYEEHDLLDLLLKEMAQAEAITPQWRAKLRVATRLLEQHIEEEERDFLPEVRKLVSHDGLIDLAAIYVRERDGIFEKKSGLKLPALLRHSVNLSTH
jgi:hypothetical protein